MPPKSCLVCKKVFKPVVHQQVYCGSKSKKTGCSYLKSTNYAEKHLYPSFIFHKYRQNAAVRGHEFLLTKDEFLVLWSKPCYYCGQGIETIGVDRVDTSLPYSTTNIVPCCKNCNIAKARMSKDEFIALVKKIASRF